MSKKEKATAEQLAETMRAMTFTDVVNFYVDNVIGGEDDMPVRLIERIASVCEDVDSFVSEEKEKVAETIKDTINKADQLKRDYDEQQNK